MNRRNFLRGLLSLPLAPLAAKLLPREFPKGIPLRLDLASGSDQTSIWQVEWNDTPIYLVDKPWDPNSVRIGKRNWLKEKINGY